MATSEHPLSSYDPAGVPSGAGRRFALVVSEWNRAITDALRAGARDTLLRHGTRTEDLQEVWVPGSFELPLGARLAIEGLQPHAVICIGSVVRGETPHFDYVCQATAQGIMQVNVGSGVPVIFCVLTDDTLQQAQDRSGGIHGNKGVDSAVAALKMAELRHTLSP
ncbi:MAG: 6,7-dimethyl-8-ribityllumazine synthase [Flavobacteriales bacterium]|nr:6,7-dimethyl-8-ribityllumazine synthase [Flavobacteriales bacterium]